MRKSGMLLLLIHFGAMVAISQTRVGLTAGALIAHNNMNNYTSDGFTYSSSAKPSYSVGIRISSQLIDQLELNYGLLLSDKGYQEKGVSEAVTNKYYFTLDQLELPINLVYLTSGPDEGLYFGGGPYLGINVRSSRKNRNSKVVETYSLGNDTYRAEGGLNLMVGYAFNKQVDVYARYAQAFSDTYVGKGTNKNAIFGLYLGVWFGK